jgi:hypothetical protein
VGAFYVYDLNFALLGNPANADMLAHLLNDAEGFFVAIGSVVADVASVTHAQHDLSMTLAFGVMIAIAGCLVLGSWFVYDRTDRVLTIAAALVLVGFLFDLLLVPGRLSANPLHGTAARYTTFNLLLLSGAYIGAVRTAIIAWSDRLPRRIAAGGFAAVMFTLVCVQVFAGTRVGIAGGIATYASHAEAADLTANYKTAPPSLVAAFAYPTSYAYFEYGAAFLDANQLNVFGDGESAAYVQSGVVAGGVVASPLPVPPEFGDIASDPAKWRAWLALSSVYEQRPDLQQAFPGATADASRKMVAWALSFGMNPADPVFAPVLQPYAKQYAAWLAQEH